MNTAETWQESIDKLWSQLETPYPRNVGINILWGNDGRTKMMIIEYTIKMPHRDGSFTAARCCGQFRNKEHFNMFKKVEGYRGYSVEAVIIVKDQS